MWKEADGAQLKIVPGHFLVGTEKNRDLKPGHIEYDAGMLTTRLPLPIRDTVGLPDPVLGVF
jgi:hypothetical protein